MGFMFSKEEETIDSVKEVVITEEDQEEQERLKNIQEIEFLTGKKHHSISRFINKIDDGTTLVDEVSKTVLIELFNQQRMYLIDICNAKSIIMKYFKFILNAYMENKIKKIENAENGGNALLPWLALNQYGEYIEHKNFEMIPSDKTQSLRSDNSSTTSNPMSTTSTMTTSSPMTRSPMLSTSEMTTTSPMSTTSEMTTTTTSGPMTTTSPETKNEIFYNVSFPNTERKIIIRFEKKDGKIQQAGPIIGQHLKGKDAKEMFSTLSSKNPDKVYYLVYLKNMSVVNTKNLFNDDEFGEFIEVLKGKVNTHFAATHNYIEESFNSKMKESKWAPIDQEISIDFSYDAYRRSTNLMINQMAKIIKSRNIHKIKEPDKFIEQIDILLTNFCDKVKMLNYK